MTTFLRPLIMEINKLSEEGMYNTHSKNSEVS